MSSEGTTQMSWGEYLKEFLRELLQSRWFKVGVLLQLVAVVVVALLFINPAWFCWTIDLVGYLAPELDGMDPLGIALTCGFRVIGALFLVGQGCYVIACWSIEKRIAKRDKELKGQHD